jgi:pimeloyl-ACP methyl ester carboxylesterase
MLRREGIRFGYLTVPENRLKPNGRTLRIAVQVLKARNPRANASPLIILHGGPGGRGIGLFPWAYDGLREQSDVILVDQRGCGFSEPAMAFGMNEEILQMFAQNLTPEQETKKRTAIAAKALAEMNRQGINADIFSSREIAADIHDLCTALSYQSWNLWGISYGTRIALTMMRDFPEGIRSVVLESPLPPNVYYFQNMNKSFRAALAKLCVKCAEDPSCRAAYPRLEEDFFAGINSLVKEPIAIAMDDAKRYPDGKFVINAQDMLLGFHQALYNKEMYSILPMLITGLKNRNEQVLRPFVESMANQIHHLNYNTYYSTVCSDCMPFNSVKVFDATAQDFGEGLTFYKDEFSICKIWNAGPFDEKDTFPVKSNIPALVLSGEMDPIAPPLNAEVTVKTLPNAFLYTFLNTGHFVSSNNAAVKLIRDFLENPAVSPDKQRLVQPGTISFATDVHIINGIGTLAPKLQLNSQNGLYISWIVVILVIAIGTLCRAIWEVVMKKRRLQLTTHSACVLFLTSFISALTLILMVKLGLSIARTAEENFYILGFGLPEKLAQSLIISYIVVFLNVVLGIMLLMEKSRQLIMVRFGTYLLLQLPFCSFIFHFGLFY